MASTQDEGITQELQQLLQVMGGLDADELLQWARARSAELIQELPVSDPLNELLVARSSGALTWTPAQDSEHIPAATQASAEESTDIASEPAAGDSVVSGELRMKNEPVEEEVDLDDL